jgi:hypothetical protein
VPVWFVVRHDSAVLYDATIVADYKPGAFRQQHPFQMLVLETGLLEPIPERVEHPASAFSQDLLCKWG